MNALRGEPVDRPAVNFYEINGTEDVSGGDPFNIYSHPSWKPLIELARDKTDRTVMRSVPFRDKQPDPTAELTATATEHDSRGNRFTTFTLRAGTRLLTRRTKRDPDINTVWTLEHLLKNEEDARAYLELPEPQFSGTPDIQKILELERELGETGIVMIDTPDPLCMAAELFSMEQFTVIAMTAPELFHRLLERFARLVQPRTEVVAKALPGRLWRIVGPEYAAPPYLPPHLFYEYVVKYDRPMVEAIQKHGGFARLHAHGRIKDILDHIAATGCMGLDPIEPPPQGDVELKYVREKYGDQFVLFGNLEANDLENLETADFMLKIERAVREGASGKGRGFVLMPSACPYGRVLSRKTLANYEKMAAMIAQ
ncbi:MAG: uroporphyrinogen decarboxylase family protein [Kiritimatiellae bacterium]|nr:uroporphyrinogen decarboxylase family protein [Kiritimatiellia bacterium]